MRLRVVPAEAWRWLTASISTWIAAAMTVLIGMFLLGMLISFWTYADSWSHKQKGKLEVKVYMCSQNCAQPATPDQINATRVRLESDPRVKSVKFISKEEALVIMRERNPEAVAVLPSNPFPDSFTVTPVKGEYTKPIAESFNPPPPGVEKANYAAKTTSRVLQVANVIKVIFLVAGIILLIASALLIANTIRLSIFARRREIEVMKLVGASNWFVRGPFVLEGLVTGLAGSIVAVFLLVLGKEFALPQIWTLSDPGVQAWPFSLVSAILIALGLALGAAGSAVTIRRFLQI